MNGLVEFMISNIVSQFSLGPHAFVTCPAQIFDSGAGQLSEPSSPATDFSALSA
jgi:hypothetical protein